MAEEPKKVRGVYEEPKGSGIWWIQYFHNGRRREKVGRRSDAIRLVALRKADILRGNKLPELQRRKPTVGELIDDALTYARENNQSVRDYVSKGELLRKSFGNRYAEDLTPADIVAWVNKREVSPATFNRYRSFLSLCYREAIRHGKVSVNPARLLRQKREPSGRYRFLNREEYEVVVAAIREHRPEKVDEFVVSVNTGMRLMEQFTIRWPQVDMDRKLIHLLKTKNWERRTIPMNSVVYDTLRRLRPAKPGKALVFPRKLNGTKAVQPRWLGEILKLKDVEIEDYTWHNNRHTFCSWLAIAGVPLRTIQELAGHKTIAMTARYAHLSPDHKGIEIEKLVTVGKPKLVSIGSATGTANGQGRTSGSGS